MLNIHVEFVLFCSEFALAAAAAAGGSTFLDLTRLRNMGQNGGNLGQVGK